MWQRFLWWRRRDREESDLDGELQAHLVIEAQQRAATGQDSTDAEIAARQAFGNLAKIREETRETWGWTHIEHFIDDMRYGLRMLRKSPGWTIVMAATLALGIGMTTAIFSLVYSILLRPLPYSQPQQLMTLWTTSTSSGAVPGLSRFNVNAVNWMEWRAQSKAFEEIALVRLIANFNLTGGGPPERLQGARSSWNLLQVLRMEPLMGRWFTEEETLSDARVVILTYGFWERRFARDSSIVGRKLQLNGVPFEVIGVMPPEYQYPTKDFELWAPLFVPPSEIQARGYFQYSSVGRLRSGVTREQAQAEISVIMRHLAERSPAGSGSDQYGTLVEPLLTSTVGQFRATLYILFAAVGCLLLIGCLNLGILLIARASARAREMVVRAALGASSGRLRRQMLAETLPLSVAGAVGGVLAAWGLLRVLLLWLPAQMPRVESVGLHGPVIGFAAAVSVLVVLLAGLLPARFVAAAQLGSKLQQDSRTVAGSGQVRSVLVAAQVAITLVILFGGGLLVRSLAALLDVSPGFRAEGVLTMHLAVARAKYPKDAQVAEYYRRLIERVKSIPGVSEAGVVNRLPLSGIGQINPVAFEDRPDLDFGSSDTRAATPGYFAAMGIPLIHGRIFSDQDKEPVGVIDEQLSRRAFGNESPLGKRFRFGTKDDGAPWAEIVGVVGHVRNDDLETDPRAQAYWPQTYRGQDRGVLVVRTSGHPESFTSAVIEQIHKEDADQPVYDVRSMEDWVDQNLQSRNLLTSLVALFGAASLLLACLGLYGVVAYGVGLRSREFGIRIALGARPGDVRRLVLAQAGRLTIMGSLVGLALAWPVGKALRSQLYGVGTGDVVALAVAPSLLLFVALLAAFGPARKAGSIDPAVTLRKD